MTSFDELRSVWGFDYPYIGDVLTISHIGEHPNADVRSKGIVLLYFEEKKTICGICDKTIHGVPNFIPIEQKCVPMVEEDLKYQEI